MIVMKRARSPGGAPAVDAAMEKWAADLARLQECIQRLVEGTRELKALRVEDAAQMPPDVRGLPYRVPMRLPPSPLSPVKTVRKARYDAIRNSFCSICDTPLRGIAVEVQLDNSFTEDIAHFILLKDYGDRLWTVEFTFPADYPHSKPTVRLHPARGNDCQPDYPEVNPGTRVVVGMRMCVPYQVRDILLELLALSATPLRLPPGHEVREVVGPDNRSIQASLEDVSRDPPNGVAVVLPDEREAWGASHYIQIRDYNGRMWQVQFILDAKYNRTVEPKVKLHPACGNDGKTEHPLVQRVGLNRREVHLGDQVPWPCSMRKILLVILNQTVPELQLSDADRSAAAEYLHAARALPRQ
jgi:hypothetical protein